MLMSSLLTMVTNDYKLSNSGFFIRGSIVSVVPSFGLYEALLHRGTHVYFQK